MSFDINKRDSQATEVEAIKPNNFDFDAYVDYEKELLQRTDEFFNSKSGVAVYRRMRAAEVFADGSRDMQRSLELQLGCLKESLKFKSDIPNFLEPWYGIGTCASAYGAEYVWNKGQAPAVLPLFDKTKEALSYNPISIAQTNIGRHTLDMIDYFLTQTKGKLPMSYTDSQSPLNASTMIVNNTNIFMDIILDPESVKQLLDNLAELMVDFVLEQKKLIGDCLANPGHGFASARNFCGYGQSDDNVVMLSNEQYIECALDSFNKVGELFGGAVFHSCGNWVDKLPILKEMKNLRMVDGAFSQQTDPDPNTSTLFRDALTGSGIILNARVVGDLKTIEKEVSQLWKPGMKLIVVTYCSTPKEQEEAYNLIHDICR